MNIEIQKILISTLVILISLIAKFFTERLLDGPKEKHQFQNRRKALVSKVMIIGIFLFTSLILLGIWEVDPQDLGIYLVSVFTIIGVAFFAQWSHLSNITAAIIIYFNHPVAIGDEIIIHDENQLRGKVSDIGLFVTTMITDEKNFFTSY